MDAALGHRRPPPLSTPRCTHGIAGLLNNAQPPILHSMTTVNIYQVVSHNRYEGNKVLWYSTHHYRHCDTRPHRMSNNRTTPENHPIYCDKGKLVEEYRCCGKLRGNRHEDRLTQSSGTASRWLWFDGRQFSYWDELTSRHSF
jgi:hypothetical protein